MQERIVKAITVPASGLTFQGEFHDGSFTQASGQTPSFSTRGRTEWIGCLGSLPTLNSYVRVFNWRGRWWYDGQTGTPPDPGSLTLVSAGFDTEGSGSTNNQTMDRKATGDDTAWITWQFDSSLLKGGGGGITWDAANYAFNLDVGEWYLWLGARTDVGDITTGVAADISTKMPTTTNGPPIVPILIRFEEYDPDTTTWESLDDSSWTAVAEVGSYDGMYTSLYRYENANESSRKVRVRSRINGNNTATAVTARMYHKKWHCWRIGT